MMREAENLYDKMNAELNALSTSSEAVLEQCDSAIDIVEDALLKLKGLAKRQSLITPLEQISFYKDTSPFFYSKYIYYAAVYRIEASKPVGERSVFKYYKTEQLKLQQFYRDSVEFYSYWRTGKNYMDNVYYSKMYPGESSMGTYDSAIDRDLFTPYSIKLAMVMASEELHAFLKSAILEAKAKKKTPAIANNGLEWTDSKTGLVELIYAWKERGSFNNGRMGIEEISRSLERAFKVKLGNVSRTYQEILSRKSGPSSYLDELRNNVLKRSGKV